MVLYPIPDRRVPYVSQLCALPRCLNGHKSTDGLIIVEWIGYVGRAVSSKQSPNWTLPPFLVQQLFLLLAPVFFAASIYMELARIILLANGEAHALVRPKRLTMTFVTGDILSFALQAMGTLINTSDHTKT
jgi:RTA1 like protein